MDDLNKLYEIINDLTEAENCLDNIDDHPLGDVSNAVHQGAACVEHALRLVMELTEEAE